ncbi:hypothetical protein MTO96_001181 [Rhipicephalus appendiculatus]
MSWRCAYLYCSQKYEPGRKELSHHSAFDLLNSSNPVAAGFKAPLRPSTLTHQREVMETAGQQLMELRLGNERLVAQDGRRMSVIAMACTLKSVSLLAEKLFDANLCK